MPQKYVHIMATTRVRRLQSKLAISQISIERLLHITLALILADVASASKLESQGDDGQIIITHQYNRAISQISHTTIHRMVYTNVHTSSSTP